MSSPKTMEDDHQSRALALDHAWKWFEFWNHLTYQVINIYVVVAAFMTAGYVSTFGAHMHMAAAAIAIGAIPATWAAYAGVKRSIAMATRAEAPMTQIQEQLSQQLNIDSIRMLPASGIHVSNWAPGAPLVRLGLTFVNVLCLAAAGVALAT